MKVKINRKILLNALNNIKPIISGKHSIEILSSIFISVKGDNSIEINATNLDMAFIGVYPAKIISRGEIVISLKELLNFISKLKSEFITIEEKEDRYINISNESFSREFLCSNIDDFPLMPQEMSEKLTMKINPYTFKHMINIASIIKDNQNTYSECAYLNFITKEEQNYFEIKSTNHLVIAIVSEKISNNNTIKNKNFLVPKDRFEKLNRSFLKNFKKKNSKKLGLFIDDADFLFGIKNKNFIIQNQNEKISILLSDGSFPNIEEKINRDVKNIVSINRNVFFDVMNQFVLMEDVDYKKILFSFETNKLKMVSDNPNLGILEKELNIQYIGKNFEVYFQAKQFVDFIKLMKSDVIHLDINLGILDKDGLYQFPCLITGDQDVGVIFGIMPYIF